MKRSPERKEKFLEAVRRGLTTAQAAEAIQVSTRTITRWRRKDRKFAALIDLIRMRPKVMKAIARAARLEAEFERTFGTKKG